MEKYRYYMKIKHQAFYVKHIYDAKDRLDLKISNSSFDFYSKDLEICHYLICSVPPMVTWLKSCLVDIYI